MHLERKSCKLIAHRGSNREAPENTLPAFKLASEAGYDGIECDVRVTKDNQLVVFHDATLDRMTGVSGVVKELTYQTIKQIHIMNGANIARYPKLKIPLLDEYLLVCKKNQLIPIIEIKTINEFHNLDMLVEKLKKYDLYDRTYIISFSKAYLEYLRSRYQYLKIQFIVGQITTDIMNYCNKNNFDVDVSYKYITQSDIKNCHRLGVLVNVWTVDDFQLAQKLIDYGVDFITTNRLI